VKLDTLFLLAKGLGLSETKIGHIKQILAKSGPVTPEAAAELIGKELVAPLKMRAAMNSHNGNTEDPNEDDDPRNPGNPGKPNCRAKLVSEDELEKYLEAGWEMEGQLQNGKIAVKKP
jgi:hypothetical protein